MGLARLEFELADHDLSPVDLARASDLTQRLAGILDAHGSQGFTRDSCFDLSVYPQGTGYVVAIEAENEGVVRGAVKDVLHVLGVAPSRVTGKRAYTDEPLAGIECASKSGLFSFLYGRKVIRDPSA